VNTVQTLAYVQTSVFVDDRYPFGGNQLATFWDKKENAQIRTDTMQGIALEMNFSETTFIEEPSITTCSAKVRIFTPAKEIPFAGHPTLGTAFVLKHTKLVKPSITKTNLELDIGIIPVEYPSPSTVRMIQPRPQHLDEFTDQAAIAATVNLPISTISSKYPMQYVSTGTPFLIVPLTSLKAIGQAQPNSSLILQTLKNQPTTKIVLLSTETVNTDSDVHVRMFAPDVGIIEDPATGSAAGPIGAYVEKYNLLHRETKGEPVIIEQGYEIRRPSQLIAKVVGKKEPENVLVSGKVKLVAEGHFYVG
jgi:trans-2,3-dihydro-3-hydroxyanthranilate isomerase